MKSNDGFCEKCGTLIAPHKCPKFVPVSKRPMGSEKQPCHLCGDSPECTMCTVCCVGITKPSRTITIPVAEYEGLVEKARLWDRLKESEAVLDELARETQATGGMGYAAIKEQEG